MYKVLDVSHSSYYNWLKCPPIVRQMAGDAINSIKHNFKVV